MLRSNSKSLESAMPAALAKITARLKFFALKL